MNDPPAMKPVSTSPRVSPAPAPEVRNVDVRYHHGELLKKASREQADEIVTQGLGDWTKATNGRSYVKLKSISAGDRCSAGQWMRSATVIRERIRCNRPGRELIPMFRFVD